METNLLVESCDIKTHRSENENIENHDSNNAATTNHSYDNSCNICKDRFEIVLQSFSSSNDFVATRVDIKKNHLITLTRKDTRNVDVYVDRPIKFCYLSFFAIFILFFMSLMTASAHIKYLEQAQIRNPLLKHSDDNVEKFQEGKVSLLEKNSSSNWLSNFKNVSDDVRDLIAIPKKISCQLFSSAPKLPGKKGIALTLRPNEDTNSTVENLPKTKFLSGYWNYVWSPKIPDQQPLDLEFIPMVWNGHETTAEFKIQLRKMVQPHIESGSVKRIMSFNEPDAKSQASMTVSRALSRWSALESLNIPIVSPSCANPYGEWMENFMSNVTKLCLRVDYIGVHWYGSPNVIAFQRYISDLYTKFRRPLILTEFAVADWSAKNNTSQNRWSQDRVLNFMKEVLPWLEKTEFIEGYAWFNFPIDRPVGWSSALFNSTGHPTALGHYYQSVRANKPIGNQKITVENNS